MSLRLLLTLMVWLALLPGAPAWCQAQGAAAPAAAPAPAPAPNLAYSSYRLGAGDVINIRVFGEDDLSKEKIRLTDAGTISYPVLGELRVLGLTVGELERIITDGLRGRYLVNPRVSVQVDEYRPFYINGMVEKPGGYPYQPGLTVRKAASLAGGFKERASMNKIFVIREHDAANKQEKVDMNSPLNPGDILTVEESFF
ncbi:MAG: polysaccharide biosynthesis/export family protein [Pseudomonadota bacterium]